MLVFSSAGKRTRSDLAPRLVGAAYPPRRVLGGAENARAAGRAAGLKSEPRATSADCNAASYSGAGSAVL